MRNFTWLHADCIAHALRSFVYPLPPLQVEEMEDFNSGYDAATDNFTDMVKAGIIDPLKVRRLGRDICLLFHIFLKGARAGARAVAWWQE